MKSILIILSALLTVPALAQVQQEIDSFGGNEALYMKAKAINPQVESEVVQNRFINRTHRFEISPEVSSVFGGDAYNQTSNAGLNVHFHINPRWSVGAKYNYSFNSLTPEGEEMVQRANNQVAANPKDPNYLYPEVVYPKSSTLGLVNYYPWVGKLSFGSMGVAHFDTYFSAGYGTMELSTSSSPLASLGIGLGFWVNSNVTTRLEYRAQQYKAEYYNKTQEMTTGVASLQMGWML